MNYTSGSTVKSGELIKVNIGGIKANMLADIQIKDDKIIENISKDNIYMEFI